RVAILKQILSEKKFIVADEYIELIAKNIESSVRELEGALNKVVTLMKLGEKPTYEEVARILQVDIESKRLRITPQRVIKSVSTIFDVPISDIKGSRRTAYVALTRQVVMYLLRKELDLPLERVAKEVNRKDHTTVIHAYKQISEKMEKDSRLAEKIESCKRELTQ
ncbi:MAG: helix-turn-helix domain-containing protein, partial [Candidatus Dojkabacteria bacterium]